MVCFHSEILGYLLKYIFFALFFCLLLYRLSVRISLPFHILFSHHFIDTYRLFSHDVTAAILVSQNETAAMLVSQTNPVGVELFSYANAFFCSMDAGHVSENTLVKLALSGHLLFPLFTLNETFIKRTPLLSRRGHLKRT